MKGYIIFKVKIIFSKLEHKKRMLIYNNGFNTYFLKLLLTKVQNIGAMHCHVSKHTREHIYEYLLLHVTISIKIII